MKKSNVLFITQTAVLLAILMVVQLMFRSIGQLAIGSIVNLILLTATLAIGRRSGLFIGLISPFLAYLLGVGPALIQIVIFVATANSLLVSVAGLLAKKSITDTSLKGMAKSAVALAFASVCKTAFLWIGGVKIAMPLMSGLSEGQVAMLTASFTWMQLVTALIGSGLAIVVVPLLLKTLRHN